MTGIAKVRQESEASSIPPAVRLLLRLTAKRGEIMLQLIRRAPKAILEWDRQMRPGWGLGTVLFGLACFVFLIVMM